MTKRLPAALALVLLLCVAAVPAAAQLAHTETVNQELFLGIELYTGFRDTVRVFGPCVLTWDDPIFADPGWVASSAILLFDLVSEDPPILVRPKDGFLPSPGEIEFPPPDPDFPAESFFDVFFELEIPEELPGEILSTDAPIRIETTARQFPPFFDRYEMEPPVPVILRNYLGDPVGEITWWRMEALPWSPPEADLIVPTVYGSDEIVVDETGIARMSAFLTNGPAPASAEFFWRPGGSMDPWTPFWLDTDGSAFGASRVFDAGEGDGWTAELDATTFDPLGSYVDLKVEFDGGIFADSETVWLDPTSLTPELVSAPAGSLLAVRLGVILKLLVRLLDEQSQEIKLLVWPVPIDTARTLETINQLGLSGATKPTKLDSASCGPTAGASCLKWLADQGHDAVEHPGGETGKPEQSGEEVARELRGDVGTNTTEGTTIDGMVSGIKSYLARHGQSGWDVSWHEVENYDDVGRMFNEFMPDGEDVIPLLEDTVTVNGVKKPRGHFVTLGSEGSSCYEVNTPEYSAYCIRYGLDFMDPWNGGSTADNEYNVGTDSRGRPTLEGYKIGDGPTRIRGFVKVSPPAAAGNSRATQRATANGWMLVDQVPAQGSGLVDTLTWDTTGFTEGVYIFKITGVGAGGREATIFKLGGIPEWTVTGSGDRPPLPRSGIRGSWPNPFNPATTIEFYVAKKGAVKISIYDAAGRLVRTLVSGDVYDAGVHRVSWDGAGNEGRPAASGVFFCRFESGGASHSRKLVLLR